MSLKVSCGDALPILRSLPDLSFTAVITDPPYNSGLNYGPTYKDKRPSEDYWKWLAAIVSEMCRIAPTVLVKHSALKIPDWCQYMPRSRMLVWVKPFSSGFPLRGVATHFEPIWWIQGRSVKWSKDYFQWNSGRGSNKEKTSGCPAQMPEKVAEWLVDTFTVPGDSVIDPFAGSGTIPVVADRMGRSALAVELNPEYCSYIQERSKHEKEEII